jgi:magnesium transporter
LGSTAGSQAATFAVGAFKSGTFSFRGFTAHLLSEILLAFAFSLVFGSLVFLSTKFVFGLENWANFLTLAVVLQILIAVTVGSVIPLTLQKFKFDPAVISIPLFTIFADISAIVILFGLYSKISGGRS